MRLDIDVKRYRRLPVPVRDVFDDWLRHEGLIERSVFYLELGEGQATLHRWSHDENGKRFLIPGTDEVAIEIEIVPISSLPPAAAFQ